ncbi:MAG: hypothetical protein ACREDU_04875, partial [Methylocella sp.]
MMGWEISINPYFAWPVLAVLGVAGLVFIALSLWTLARGWWLRGLALALLFAALLNPSLRQEERESLSDIAVAVVDRSLSQNAGNRTQQTSDAESALKQQVARLGNTELRVVEVRSGITSDDDGTRAFEALS